VEPVRNIMEHSLEITALANRIEHYSSSAVTIMKVNRVNITPKVKIKILCCSTP
jgi:hypothetical protein